MEANISRTLLALAVLGAPSVAFAHHGRSYGSAMVTVHNDTPAVVTASVAGITVPLSSGETRSIAVPAGSSTLVATYQQFGRTYTLRTQGFYLRSGRSTYVELDAPLTTRVMLTNQSDRAGVVLMNGVQAESLGPHESELVNVPVGMTSFAFLVGGQQVDTDRVQVVAMADLRVNLDLPRVGDLVVYNPLPIPVVVTTDRGLSRTVAAFGQACFDDLAVGTVRLRATRTTGELVDELVATVRPLDRQQLTVDPPRTGLVAIDNDSGASIEVFEQGRKLGCYGPGTETRLLLGIGWHELEVRDAYGRELAERWIEVKPYDAAELEVGGRRHEPAYRSSDEREDDDGYVSRR